MTASLSARLDRIDLPIPDLWDRVARRRTFMRDALGIDPHPDVLPLSSLPAFLPPFPLRPDMAMTVGG